MHPAWRFAFRGLTALVCGFISASAALAEPISVGASSEGDFDAVGYLDRRMPQGVAPQYVITDVDGVVRFRISPSSDAPLAQYVGRRVGLRGKVWVMGEDESVHIRAREAVPLDRFGRVDPSVRQAAYDEAIDPVAAVQPGSQVPESTTTLSAFAPGLVALAGGQSPLGGPAWSGYAPPPPMAPPPYRGCGTPPPIVGVPPVAPMAAAPLLPAYYASSSERVYGKVEYLSWWMKGDKPPPLVTTAPLGTPIFTAGAIGDPNTTVLFGGDRINDGQRNGGRAVAGLWFIPDGLGAEGHYWTLARETTTFNADSNFVLDPNAIILAKPLIFNGTEIGAPLAHPDFFEIGSVDIRATSDVQSAGGVLRAVLARNALGRMHLSAVGGYRFFRLDEDISTFTESIHFDDGLIDNLVLEASENVDTKNIFNGGELGLIGEIRGARWFFQGDTRVALGNMQQTLTYDQSLSIATVGNPPIVIPLGPGTAKQNQFSTISQADLRLGYQLTRVVAVVAGYDFTFVTKVLRPGNEIDRGVPPSFVLNSTSLWIQGVSAGVDLRF